MDREVLLTQEQPQNSFIFFQSIKEKRPARQFLPFLKYLPKSLKDVQSALYLMILVVFFFSLKAIHSVIPLRETFIFLFLKPWLFNLLCTIAYKIFTNIFS